MENATPTPPPAVRNPLERLLDEAEALSTPPASDAPAPISDGTPSGDTAPPAPLIPPAETVPSPPRGASDESTPLGALLSNPALLSALPSLMENLSPLLSGVTKGVGSAPSATRPHSIDRHTALLCALKPYLSPQRRDTAETVIRLCRVWDALEKSGISLAGLSGLLGNASSSGEGRDHRVQ